MGIENGSREVIHDCRSVVNINCSVVPNNQNVYNEKVKENETDGSQITLEAIAQDISEILDKLTFHLESVIVAETTHRSNVNANKSTRNDKAPPKSKPANNPNCKWSTTFPKSSRQSAKTSSSKKLIRLNRVLADKEEYDPLSILKEQVQRAIAEGKTFTSHANNLTVTESLVRRGWVEKIDQMSYRFRCNKQLKNFQNHSILKLLNLIRVKELTEICKRMIKSKLLADHQVDLYWSFSSEVFRECSDTVKLTKINKIRRTQFSYTSKQGLCNAYRKSYIPQNPVSSKMNHPRTYSLCKDGDTRYFIRDFNTTAAMSLLKWVVHNSVGQNCEVISPTGKIPLVVFDFAIHECRNAIAKVNCEFSGKNIVTEALEHDWTIFLEYFYKATQMDDHFKDDGTTTLAEMVRKSNYILSKLAEMWPYLDMDGMMNIWILKPANGSRGIGIHICRTIKFILDIVRSHPSMRYIIQKYIERPFLIHNTKFDIRQWFLISSAVPLTIWMYKSCYVRFSSKIYNLRELHESIHLTNNSVQCRYERLRDNGLPLYNMWDCSQFKKHLSDIGFPNAFDDIIYPGMRQCIIAVILLLQDTLEQRRNSFELYGADFILTEDFKPWLLEINCNPALRYSTPVTSKMCPMVVEDVIKVVLDYENNKTAGTGDFELIYQEIENPKRPISPRYNMQPDFHPPLRQPSSSREGVQSATNDNTLVEVEVVSCIKETRNGIEKILEELIRLLKRKNQKDYNNMNYSMNHTRNTVVPCSYFDMPKTTLPLIHPEDRS